MSGLFVATIIFLQCAPDAFAAIQWKYYLVFIVLTTINFFLVWFYFPEVCDRIRKTPSIADNGLQTKGKRLEDIGELFGDSIESAPLDTKTQFDYEHNFESEKGAYPGGVDRVNEVE